MISSNSSDDRNFLFGILALQAGVVTDSQLIDAMKRWTFSKTKRMSDVLVEQSAISEGQVALIQPMVDAYVKLNNDDPSKALCSASSVAQIQSIQDTCKNDDELADFSSIQTLRWQSETTKDKVHIKEKSRPAPQARFQVIRPHAKGGLGEVFIAKDNELNREVALKEIQEQFADEEQSQGRFVLEAEITGSLEHPGIVPVYGLGCYSDGRPYYAMRFIDGSSLKDATEKFFESDFNPSQRQVELRKLLGRCIDVCQAVGYAHSRGVLHRDLKPANIMLGKYGETLVVDWGLAKAVGRNDKAREESNEATLHPTSGSTINPTMIGRAIGTPAFMPPEQATGDLENLGPQSDIYSLGATLYYILTGKAPFDGRDANFILEQVSNGKFVPPRLMNKHIPNALSAICSKAMALSPDDRYQTTVELSDDIERFLADEPVKVVVEPVLVRTRRWIRKHPTISTTTAALVLFTTFFLVVFSAVVGGKNSQLASLNSDLDRSNQELESKNKELENSIANEARMRKLAETNEKTARSQSELALGTLQNVIFDVQKQIEGFPEAAKIRSRILVASIAKLNEVAKSFVSSSKIDRSVAVGFSELGRLVMESSNVELSGLNLEDIDRIADKSRVETATSLYESGLKIFDRIAAADPSSLQAKRDSAVVRGFIALLEMEQGDLENAKKALNESQKIFEDVANLKPGNLEFQRDIAVGHQKLAEVCMWGNEITEATEHAGKSIEIMRRIFHRSPSDKGAKVDLNEAKRLLGEIFLAGGEVSKAEPYFQEAFEKGAPDSDTAGNAYRSIFARAVSTTKLGDVYSQTNRLDEAEGVYQMGFEIINAIAKEYPDKLDINQLLMKNFFGVGKVKEKKRDFKQAESFYEDGLSLARKIVKSRPKKTESLLDLAYAIETLAGVLIEQGSVEEAALKFEESLAIREKIENEYPNHMVANFRLSESFEKLGDIESEKRNWRDAEKHFILSLEIRKKLLGNQSGNPSDVFAVARLYNKLGDVVTSSGRLEIATENFSQAINVLRHYLTVDPDNHNVEAELELCRVRLGTCLLMLGRIEEAMPKFNESLTAGKRLCSLHPDRPSMQMVVAKALIGIANAWVKRNDFENAIEVYPAAIKELEKLVALAPYAAESNRDCGLARENLGVLFQKQEQFHNAIAQYGAAIAVFQDMIDKRLLVDFAKQKQARIQEKIAYLNRLPLVTGDFTVLMGQDPESLPLLLMNRSVYFLGKNDFETTAQAAAALMELETVVPDDLYKVAIVFCSCIEKQYSQDAELNEMKRKQKEEWTRLAIDALKKSIEKGWNEFDLMANENRFGPIRSDSRFRKLLEESKNTVDKK